MIRGSIIASYRGWGIYLHCPITSAALTGVGGAGGGGLQPDTPPHTGKRRWIAAYVLESPPNGDVSSLVELRGLLGYGM